MQIVIEIPNEEVPNKQEIIDISLHFIAGEVCECTYPYTVLPKGHGRIVDIGPYEGKVIASRKYCGVNRLVEVAELDTIIEADKAESEVSDGDSD